MTEKHTIKRRIWTAAVVTTAASSLALISAPATAQFFPWLGGPRYEPQIERPQPQADYSKAPTAKKAETPPTSTVVVMGDSMADWLAYGLEEAFADTPEIGIIRKQKPLSGLIRYESRSELEWSSVVRDIMNAEKPAVAVMIVGLSDRGPIRERAGARPAPATAPAGAPAQGEAPAPGAESSELQIVAPEQPRGRGSSNEFRSEIWAELYSKRIAETITALKSKGVPVLWVGLPVIRGPNATRDAQYLNELYRAQAEKAGVIYVDVWDGFVDESGKFASSGPDVDGQTRRLRTPDGVYFTKYGARKLAHFVEREIRRVLNARAVPVALPLDGATRPAAPPRPEGPVARPVAGSVLPLAAGPAAASEELAGGGAPRASATDPIATRVLVKGEPVLPLKGRADDFVWGGGAQLPTANMTAEPGTIKPVDPATATAATEEKPQTETQAAAVQPPKKPRPPPAPVQQQQRPFFSPFGFFR